MEDQSEQVPEAFTCCICLELLYKPVVLACGHASCFWCVHKSMNGLRESHCPICRYPYYHFPTICQMVNSLLVKMYPVTYKRREIQVLEEEKKTGFFSPTFDNLFCASHANEELNHVDNQSESSFTNKADNLFSNHSTPKKVEPCADMELSESVISSQNNSLTCPKRTTTESFRVQEVSVDDMLCATCKQLLFRPVVLNCGHVYCETCMVPADQAIRCQICQSSHPKGFPKVFLELHHFLEEHFPKEYMERKRTVEVREVQFHHERPSTCSTAGGKKRDRISFTEDENFWQLLGAHGWKFHIGVGCDTCGVYPIIGDRYRCMDCKEAIGFDVCGDCYNTNSKLPGRFNQQHTADHRFELVQSRSGHNLLLGMLRGQLEDGSSVLILSDDASENPETESPPTPSGNAPGDGGNDQNDSVAPSTSNNAEEHQR